jgi:hypothetical protein
MELSGIGVPTEDGRWVSENHARIAEIIKDYDSELELAYIPPDKREPGDVPFAVVHRPMGKPAYVVFTSDSCDERLLTRLFAADGAKQGNILTNLDAHNAAVEVIRTKERMDEIEERDDLVHSIVKSPLNTYKHNGIKYQ